MKLSSLSFLVLSFAATLVNIRSGLIMSETNDHDADNHFLAAIIGLVFLLIAGFAVFRMLQEIHDTLRRQLLENETPETTTALAQFEKQKENLLFLVFGAAGLGVVSLITGTISHAGSFPWLHGLMGFALLGTQGLAIFSLIRFK